MKRASRAAGERRMSQGLPGMMRPPVARLIGFRVVEASAGEAKGELRIGMRHAGPGGTVHGGILCDLADAVMGLAFASTLRGRQSAVTVELHIHFLRPIWNGRVIAAARVVQRGRRLGLIDCRISDTADRLIAVASSTCLVLARPWAPRPTGAARSRARGTSRP